MNRRAAAWTLVLVAMTTAAGAQDWKRYRVPADPGEGREWRLNEVVSDDFNYTHKPTTEKATLRDKWTNRYFNGGWDGPGTTLWRHENVAVAKGKLWIRATRELGETKKFFQGADENGKPKQHVLPATRLGCITSIETVRYPVYVEAKTKAANAVLASDVWLLSEDSTQEIDIQECYGGRGDDDRADWFARRLHMSHHVFIRRPFQDYQPKDDSTWIYSDRKARRGRSYWTEKFHRVGVYWKSPTELEYYLDGELVKTTTGLDDKDGKGGIDPKGYTKDASGKRTGLVKPMKIIINMEAQDWNAVAGRHPTDDELKRTDDHTFLVDWIRVYEPVAKK